MTKQFNEEYTLSRTNFLDQEDSISLERRFYMENLESLNQNSEMTSANNQASEQDGQLINENDEERINQPQQPDQNRTPRIFSTLSFWSRSRAKILVITINCKKPSIVLSQSL